MKKVKLGNNFLAPDPNPEYSLALWSTFLMFSSGSDAPSPYWFIKKYLQVKPYFIKSPWGGLDKPTHIMWL